MTDQSIFEGTPQATPAVQAPTDQQAKPVAQPVSSELLKMIVDDQGRQKYDTVDKALEGLANAQAYIPQLHQKVDTLTAANSALEAKVAAADSVDDVISRIENRRTEPQVSDTPVPVGLDADAARQLFSSMLTETKQADVIEQNQSAVIKSLVEKFGDKAEEMFKSKATELSLSLDDMNSLSGTSPKAVLAYFGAATSNASLDVSDGTINSDGNQGEPQTIWGNTGKSVLSGSTSFDVRAEASRVKDLVSKVHEAGGTIEDMSNPKVYRETFGKR